MVWEDAASDIEVHLPITLGNTSYTDPFDNAVYTVSGIHEYQLNILEVQGNETVPVRTLTSQTGDFTVPAEAFGGMVLFEVRITYTITGPNTSHYQEWPVLVFIANVI
jgi:hypothetical protein